MYDVDVKLTAVSTYDLRDMLIKRAEQGAPLEVLDLRSSVAADRAIQLLRGATGCATDDTGGTSVAQLSGRNWALQLC